MSEEPRLLGGGHGAACGGSLQSSSLIGESYPSSKVVLAEAMMMGPSCRCSSAADITITVKRRRSSRDDGRPPLVLGVAIGDDRSTYTDLVDEGRFL